MAHTPATEAALRRDRLVVAAGLALVAAVAWAWTLASTGGPMAPDGGGGMLVADAGVAAPMHPEPWSPAHTALVFLCGG